MTNLTVIALVLLSILTKRPHPSPSEILIARAVVHAVEVDEEPPITGDKPGDVALAMRFVLEESSFRLTDKTGACISGDGGRALGIFQEQNTPPAQACDPTIAARIWFGMAHRSVAQCAWLDPDDRLALLASGSCDRGRVVSRRRMRAALVDLQMALAQMAQIQVQP